MATSLICGQALSPLGVRRLPKALTFSGVSGTSMTVASRAIRRNPNKNAWGVEGVARGLHTRRKSSTKGLAPRR